MNCHALESTRQLEFLTELVNSHTEVADDVIRIGSSTWAIHGSVPRDGQVLVAEYDSLESAQRALAQLPPNWVSGNDLWAQPDRPHRSFARPTTSDVAPVTASADQRAGAAPAYYRGRTSAVWRAALQPQVRPADA
jgi:hypothetical protein